MRVRSSRLLSAVATHAVLICVCVMTLVPISTIVFTAFMSAQQSLDGSVLPHPWTFTNIPTVLRTIPFVRYLGNTVLIALLSTVGILLSATPVAYALSHLRFRGRKALFLMILAAMMLPVQVTVIPLYVMWAHLGLVGTPVPLVAPAFLLDAFSVFLLRQFFVSIPHSYVEAARLDGASEWRILRQVVVPMGRSALAAVALFSFFYCWNDFFAPLLYLGSNDQWKTLSLALAGFKGTRGIEWNLMMAATSIFILPVIVVFVLAQKLFVQGITFSGVRG